MSGHAIMSASSASRWLACPGSVALSMGEESKSSKYAAEGTVAHDIAACVLEGAKHPALGELVKCDGFIVEVTQEMLDAVEMYVAFVRGVGDERHIEVDLSEALKKYDDWFGGTADAVCIHDNVLEVIDFKYGSGKLVAADENPQLIYYALGAFLTFQNLQIGKVRVSICQPRCGDGDKFRTYEFSALELFDFLEAILHAATQAREPDAALVPGPEQCQWCPAKAKCPALEKQQQELMRVEFDEHHLPAARLAEVLDYLPQVEARCKALRQLAYDRAMNGEDIPNHKLVAKRGTRQWSDEAAVKSVLKDNEACFTAPKLKSVAQVEKVLGKPAFRTRLENLTSMVSSGYTLVHDSDKRPAAKAEPRIADASDFDD